MPLGNTTIAIQRARIAVLMDECARLREENARLRTALNTNTSPTDPCEPDYGPGGMEWIDPSTGADTWHS